MKQCLQTILGQNACITTHNLFWSLCRASVETVLSWACCSRLCRAWGTRCCTTQSLHKKALFMMSYAVVDGLGGPGWHWSDCSGNGNELFTLLRHGTKYMILWWCWCLGNSNYHEPFSRLAGQTKVSLTQRIEMKHGIRRCLFVSLLAWMTLQLCGACCLHPIATASRFLSQPGAWFLVPRP